MQNHRLWATREYTLDCKPKCTAGRTACCCAGAGCGCGCGCHGAAGRHAAYYTACPHPPPRPACPRGLPAARALGPPPCCAPRRSAPRPAAARDPCRQHPAGSAWLLRNVYTKRGDSAPTELLESVYYTHIQVYNTTYSAVRKVVAAQLQPTCAVPSCALRAVYACFRTRGECERGTHLLSGMASPGKGASGLAAVLSPGRALAPPPFPGCAQSSRPLFASVPGTLL